MAKIAKLYKLKKNMTLCRVPLRTGLKLKDDYFGKNRNNRVNHALPSQKYARGKPIRSLC